MKLFKLSLLSILVSSFTLVGFTTFSVTEGAAPAMACDLADPDCLD